MSTTQQEFMTADELAARLRVNVSTIYEGARNGQIPCLRLGSKGKRVLFKTDVIDRLMAQQGGTIVEETKRLTVTVPVALVDRLNTVVASQNSSQSAIVTELLKTLPEVTNDA